MAEIGPVGIAQPTLIIEPEIAAGLLSGKFVRLGGTVRDAETGRIAKHLPEAGGPEKIVDEAVKRVRVNPWVIVPVLLVTAACAGARVYVLRKRKKAAVGSVVRAGSVGSPECVTNFEASLRAYVDVARVGMLDNVVVGRLITNLDALRAWVDDGNDVTFSFEQLEPLFSLVNGHTHALAKVYSVDLGDLDREGDTETVVHLRQHLEAQKRILGGAA